MFRGPLAYLFTVSARYRVEVPAVRQTCQLRSAHGPFGAAGVVARTAGGRWYPGGRAGKRDTASRRAQGELPQSVFPDDDDPLPDLPGGVRTRAPAGRQLEDLQRPGAGS